jgi:hypothetical protein
MHKRVHGQPPLFVTVHGGHEPEEWQMADGKMKETIENENENEDEDEWRGKRNSSS